MRGSLEGCTSFGILTKYAVSDIEGEMIFNHEHVCGNTSTCEIIDLD